MSALGFVSLYVNTLVYWREKPDDSAIMVDIGLHIDSFHANYAVYLEDNR